MSSETRDSLTFEIIQDIDWLSFQEGDPGLPGIAY